MISNSYKPIFYSHQNIETISDKYIYRYIYINLENVETNCVILQDNNTSQK